MQNKTLLSGFSPRSFSKRALLIISFIISIIGIFIIFLILITIKPELVEIKKINSDLLYKKIQIKGEITKIKEYKDYDFKILTINDSTGKINVLINNKDIQKINLKENQIIMVAGKITEYKNELEIQADRVQKLSLSN